MCQCKRQVVLILVHAGADMEHVNANGRLHDLSKIFTLSVQHAHEYTVTGEASGKEGKRMLLV